MKGKKFDSRMHLKSWRARGIAVTPLKRRWIHDHLAIQLPISPVVDTEHTQTILLQDDNLFIPHTPKIRDHPFDTKSADSLGNLSQMDIFEISCQANRARALPNELGRCLSARPNDRSHPARTCFGHKVEGFDDMPCPDVLRGLGYEGKSLSS